MQAERLTAMAAVLDAERQAKALLEEARAAAVQAGGPDMWPPVTCSAAERAPRGCTCERATLVIKCKLLVHGVDTELCKPFCVQQWAA